MIGSNVLLARDQFSLDAAIASRETPSSVSGDYAVFLDSNSYSYYVTGAMESTVGGLKNIFPTNILGVVCNFLPVIMLETAIVLVIRVLLERAVQSVGAGVKMGSIIGGGGGRNPLHWTDKQWYL